MRYIRYRRKSSEQLERQALSIQSQKLELDKKFSNLEIIADLEESHSAFHPESRPQFQKMVEMIKEGEADGIIAWHPRLSRNEVDAAKIAYLTRTGIIKDLKFGSYSFENSPEGIMNLQAALSHSQYSSSKLSVEVKRGLRTKAEKGWLPWSSPKSGYMWDRMADKGNKTLLEDPLRYPLIDKCWDFMLTGTYTVGQILIKLNDEWGYRTVKSKRLGGKPMCRSQLYRIFTDTFYYGYYEYLDENEKAIGHIGNHTPMVTEEEFNKVQILLGRKGRPRPKKHTFTYTGLMTCGQCEAMITAEEKWQVVCSKCKYKFSSKNKDACPECNLIIEEMVNPTLRHYIYYHCTKRKDPNCTQGSIQMEELEKQVDSLLSKIQISEDFKNWAIKYLNELNDKEIDNRNAILGSLQSAYDDVVKRIDNLVRLKISPQNTEGALLSDEDFKNQKDSLMKEKAKLQERLDDTDNRINRWVELSEKTFNFACYAKHWFANGDSQKKKEIFFGLGSNLTLFNKIVGVRLEKPLEWAKEAIEKIPEISPMFEPKEKGYTEAQMFAFYSKNPVLLAKWDDFRQINWIKEIECPELTLLQIKELLSITV